MVKNSQNCQFYHSTTVLDKSKKHTSSTSRISRKAKRFWLIRQVRYFLIRLLRLRETPPVIARGLAVGVFSGFIPLFGLQMILALVFAVYLKGNKFAAFAATWISNPLTYVPIYWFNFKVGKLFLKGTELPLSDLDFQLNWQSWSKMMELGFIFVITLFIGSIFMGLLAGFVTYFLSKYLITRFQSRH